MTTENSNPIWLDSAQMPLILSAILLMSFISLCLVMFSPGIIRATSPELSP